MTRSLCETCTFLREVTTPKGSRFLLCRLSQSNPAYPKYPPQPVLQCEGYRGNVNPTSENLSDRRGRGDEG
jgi:hypothetical protein